MRAHLYIMNKIQVLIKEKRRYLSKNNLNKSTQILKLKILDIFKLFLNVQ